MERRTFKSTSLIPRLHVRRARWVNCMYSYTTLVTIGLTFFDLDAQGRSDVLEEASLKIVGGDMPHDHATGEQFWTTVKLLPDEVMRKRC